MVFVKPLPHILRLTAAAMSAASVLLDISITAFWSGQNQLRSFLYHCCSCWHLAATLEVLIYTLGKAIH